VQGVPEIGVLPHAVAVAANRHDVAMMDEPIDQRDGHDSTSLQNGHRYHNARVYRLVGANNTRRTGTRCSKGKRSEIARALHAV
jgi:hypothetical protein